MSIDQQAILIQVQEKVLTDIIGFRVHIDPPKIKNGLFSAYAEGCQLKGTGHSLGSAVTNFIGNVKK